MAVHPGSPRLLLVFLVDPGGAGDGLAVGDAGQGQLGLDGVPALQLLEEHIKLHVAHSAQDLLVRRLLAVQLERGVLIEKLVQAGEDLLLVALGLG